MTESIAVPRCAVDVYPFEGGSLRLTGASVLTCTVSKDIFEQYGEFRIELPPGGPTGPSSTPSWSEIITPMSLVVIAMSRGDDAAVVMIGVVTQTTEPQEWTADSPVQRRTIIRGADFGYFFAMFSYYALFYLGAAGAAIAAPGAPPAIALNAILGPGYFTGDPASIAQAWYENIMAGPNGILANTVAPYRGNRVPFRDILATLFQPYDVVVPNGQYFIPVDGTWADKFRAILPHPFYEFFINTAQPGFYPGATAAGTTFTTTGLGPSIEGQVFLVARKNPTPQLTADIADGVPSLTGIDVDLWNALPLNQLDTGFIRSEVSFTESEASNFYLLNPTWLGGLFGQDNYNPLPFVFKFAAMGDAASIARYGFRPNTSSFSWMADVAGADAINGAQGGPTGDLNALVGSLLARFASWRHPLPLMSQGVVTTLLRPSQRAGVRFRYAPYKGQSTWDYYATGFVHTFSFGGQSTTNIRVTRGLPTSVYQDAGSAGVLFNVHRGNAMRKDGVYGSGLPTGSQPPLIAIGMEQFQSFLSSIAKVYVTPQTP